MVWERTEAVMQALLDDSPLAYFYFNDQFATYDTLVYYPALHQSLPEKSQTYSVEADNAELRHYLARLARKSRCFSRCIHALWRAVKLFVFAWNRRQLHKRRFPNYPAYAYEFVSP